MIGIISDTHDNIPNILKAVKIFREKGCGLVLHLGDIIAPATIKFFDGLNMKFIRGNCDGDIKKIKSKIAEIHGEFLEKNELVVNNKRIALFHKLPENLEHLSKNYDYIFYGHDHKKGNEKIGKTRIINPGGHYLGDKEHSIVVLCMEKDEVEFISII